MAACRFKQYGSAEAWQDLFAWRGGNGWKNKYIAKELGIFKAARIYKTAKSGWPIMANHPAPDTPIDDPIQQLLGEDKNNNGVRDDFEELILNSRIIRACQQHALQAGKGLWTSLNAAYFG